MDSYIKMGRVENRYKDIIEFAKNNNDSIGYILIADMLEDRLGVVASEDLDIVISRLKSEGIAITDADEEDYEKDVDITPAFNPADVNIHSKPLTVGALVDELRYGEIELDPEFQRNPNLWSHDKQSRLIESLMLKIPLPAFYFDASKSDNYAVIDGLQRLSSFKNYLLLENKFEGLQYLKDFNGKSYGELPRQYQRRIMESSINAYIVEKGTPDSVVYNIFQRINTGGLKLEPQEIRHALYPGKATKIAEELSKSEEFLKTTDWSISPTRMMDQEFITRFFSFTELDYRTEYKGSIDEYLIKSMKLVNNYDDDQLDLIRGNFYKTMKYARLIFGRNAFRRLSSNGRRGPINKALFEVISVIFSGMTIEELDELVLKKEFVNEKYLEIIERTDFLIAIKSGDIGSVIRRMDLGKEIFRIKQ